MTTHYYKRRSIRLGSTSNYVKEVMENYKENDLEWGNFGIKRGKLDKIRGISRVF